MTQIFTIKAGNVGNPIVSKAINQIAARFSIPVSEKLAAQSIPIIGALGGATINLLFISYFQDLAHAHFSLRRLERNYTPELVISFVVLKDLFNSALLNISGNLILPIPGCSYALVYARKNALPGMALKQATMPYAQYSLKGWPTPLRNLAHRC
jgi:hypothetical protein